MYVCYVDEAGDAGLLPSPTHNEATPLFIVAGVAVPQDQVDPLTSDLLRLKAQFNPRALGPRPKFLDWALLEINGASLRRRLRSGSRRQIRHAYGYLDKLVALLERRRARVFGRIWIKKIGAPINGRSIYTFSMQAICANFQALLRREGEKGIIIADSRDPSGNAIVAHSIFTQKFRLAGDLYNRMVEMPVFGHSQNHAGLQVADVLASGLLFPIASSVYCSGTVDSVHVCEEFAAVRARYIDRLRKLQFRYAERGEKRGGIVVSDQQAHRSGAELFRRSLPAKAYQGEQGSR